MQNTIVVMSSNREVEKETQHTPQNLASPGAMLLMEAGSADVAFARCRALSWACEKLRGYRPRAGSPALERPAALPELLLVLVEVAVVGGVEAPN